MSSAPGAIARLGERDYLYFAGAGYLGLQGHPDVIEALRAGATRWGVHSATSRTLFGDTAPLREVERLAARLLGADEALCLVSGYAGNFALTAALDPHVNLALVDEAAHDSFREAARQLTHLERPPMVFRHRDVDHLRSLLAAAARPGPRPLALTDGVFPVTGELAPLGDYLAALAECDGMLLVDDAHGLATVGPAGRGSLELAGVAADSINLDPDEPSPAGARVFHTATLSKAVGGYGGVIAGSRALLARVRRSSGWHRAASGVPAPIAAATAAALSIVVDSPALRRRLAENVSLARAGLRKIGLAVSSSPAPVIGVALDGSQRMAAVQRRLLDQGIAIAYVRNYAGAGPAGILRIAVFATHTREMIERLIEALDEALDD